MCKHCGRDPHANLCPLLTNWWVAPVTSRMRCFLCNSMLHWGHRYRLIPSLPEDDPGFDPEDIGGDWVQFDKVICERCARLHIVPMEAKPQQTEGRGEQWS